MTKSRGTKVVDLTLTDTISYLDKTGITTERGFNPGGMNGGRNGGPGRGMQMPPQGGNNP